MKTSKTTKASKTGDSTKRTTKDPCWTGYEQVGMKWKNGKKVPNCVPVKK